MAISQPSRKKPKEEPKTPQAKDMYRSSENYKPKQYMILPEVAAQIRKLAFDRDVSASALVRDALDQYLSQPKNHPNN